MRDDLGLLVVGLGRLGLPLAGVLAAAGFDVYGADSDPEVLGRIIRGGGGWDEPGLDELLARNLFHVSDTVDLCPMVDVAFVVVPTPSLPDGSFDSSLVCAAVSDVCRGFRNRARHERPTVVVVSTVSPGTMTGPVIGVVRAEGFTPGVDIDVVYMPALIALGTVISDLRCPDVVMVGADDDRAASTVVGVMRRVVPEYVPIRVGSMVGTEIAKLSINAFLSVKIGFANTVARVCEQFPGANAADVLQTIGADTRVGPKFLRHGGTGSGQCLPRDVVAFETCGGTGASTMVRMADAEALEWVAEQVATAIAASPARFFAHEVAVLGVSYKPGIAISTDSFGIRILGRLRVLFDVVVHDPLCAVDIQRVAQITDLGDVLDAAVVIVACDHPEYHGLVPHEDQTVIDVWGCCAAVSGVVRPGVG